MTQHPAVWMARVLRRAGVHVIEEDNWREKGRPDYIGDFLPNSVIWHHDASPVGPSPSLANYIANVGRPPGVPAPLSQVWVCMGCNGQHPVGTWHLLAAGRANHAGEGDGWGRIPRNSGNTYALGIETDNTVGEPTPKEMYDSLVLGTAALLRHMRSRPGNSLCGHKEYAPGRKSDPDDIDMGRARADVRRTMRRLASTSQPVVHLENIRLGVRHPDVLVVQKALTKYVGFVLGRTAGRWNWRTQRAYDRARRKMGYTGADARGSVGRESLTRLGRLYHFTVK